MKTDEAPGVAHAPENTRAYRLKRFSLTCADAGRLARFYEAAFGFRRLTTRSLRGSVFQDLMGVASGARSDVLSLGSETLELLEFERPGQHYPVGSVASDLIFQHFALVTANFARTYRRLLAVSDWTPISNGGPQRLPDSSGGVTAFKFRDPEGHPLELLGFPEGRTPARWPITPDSDACLGIDHSALSVSDTARSIAFYQQQLGLRVGGQTLNRGTEQERLDGVLHPEVEVSALQTCADGPHVELLCYRSDVHSARAALQNNDVAASRLIFEIESAGTPEGADVVGRCFTDPDGHHLVVARLEGEAAARPSNLI